MNSVDIKTWPSNLEISAKILWTQLAGYIPSIFGTLLLLIIGYFISKLVARVSIKLLRTVGIDKISEKVGLHKALQRIGIQLKSSDLFGKVFFWLIMLIFVISASEVLQLDKITDTIDAFVRYLPNILGAGLILILGLMVAHFLKGIIENISEKSNLEYGKVLATVIHLLVIVVVSVLAIDQLQLETELINRIMEIVLISVGVVIALSLGLGTKDLSKSVVSGWSLKDQIKPGSYLEFESINGTVKKINNLNTIVETSEGKTVHIPNSMLISHIFKSK